ncbi:TNF receptor-associated factor 1-like [Protopterus annectens]|uniref:TNF receptor-associated factor 1-like n=1 Tax=Protopterus annectens TaxID=7888 RepID=UPI001CF9C263|nr:TNF receptor-associated factor 1-like [Protopterus annectens]
MAENDKRVSENVFSSSPDENEFPSGYPTNICDDVPEPKYLCCNCKNILKKAQQTLCGHRYCFACLSWLVRNNNNPVCQKCKEEDPTNVNEEIILSLERAFTDAAVNKEISEMKVHCSNAICSWNGVMKKYEDHQTQCGYALIPCNTGCGHMIVRRKLAFHLESECINNMIPCPKCLRKVFNKDFQKHICEVKEKRSSKSKTENMSKDKSRQFSGHRNKDECKYTEIGCTVKGNKEKLKEHEASSLVSHMGLMLQLVCQLKKQFSAENSTEEANVPLFVISSKEKEMQATIPGQHVKEAVEINGDLESDSCPAAAPSLDTQHITVDTYKSKIVSLEEKMQVFENVVTVLYKKVEKSDLTVTALKRRHFIDQETIQILDEEVKQLQRNLTTKETVIKELHEQVHSAEIATYDGMFLWKISDFTKKQQDAVTGRITSLSSPIFFTSKYGYKVCLRIYLNGDGAGRGSHISLFFVILRGEYDALLPWPFKHKVTFMILDQNSREHFIDAFRPDIKSASFKRPISDSNVASGCPLFIELSKLQTPKPAYVKDDTLFIKCIIDVNS